MPEDYRARALTLVHATFSLGTVVGMLVTPQLVAPFGWPGALKGFTLLGLAWVVRPCPCFLLKKACNVQCTHGHFRPMAQCEEGSDISAVPSFVLC